MLKFVEKHLIIISIALILLVRISGLVGIIPFVVFSLVFSGLLYKAYKPILEEKNESKKITGIIVGIAWGLRLISVFIIYYVININSSGFISDALGYIEYGRQMVLLWQTGIIGILTPGYHYGYYVVASLGILVAGENFQFFLALLNTFVSCLIALKSYRILRTFSDSKYSIAALYGILLYPSFAFFSLLIMKEMFVIYLMTLFLEHSIYFIKECALSTLFKLIGIAFAIQSMRYQYGILHFGMILLLLGIMLVQRRMKPSVQAISYFLIVLALMVTTIQINNFLISKQLDLPELSKNFRLSGERLKEEMTAPEVAGDQNNNENINTTSAGNKNNKQEKSLFNVKSILSGFISSTNKTIKDTKKIVVPLMEIGKTVEAGKGSGYKNTIFTNIDARTPIGFVLQMCLGTLTLFFAPTLFSENTSILVSFAKVETLIWSIVIIFFFIPSMIGLFKRSAKDAIIVLVYGGLLCLTCVAASYNIGLLYRMRLQIVPIVICIAVMQIDYYIKLLKKSNWSKLKWINKL